MPRVGGSRGGSSRSSSSHSRGGISRSRHSSMSRSSSYSGHRHHYGHSTIIIGGSSAGYGTTTSEPLYSSPKANRLSAVRAALIVITIMAVFFMLVAFSILRTSVCPVNGVSIEDIQADYNYYHNMIILAKQNDDIVEGTITNIAKDSWSDKWYFEYEIDVLGMTTTTHFIYPVFTDAEIAEYSIGDKIDVAVNDSRVTITTDSVPVIFENYTWEDDGDISAINRWKAYDTIFATVVVAVIVGSIIGLVIMSKKIKKEESEYLSKNDKNTSTSSYTQCAYCGSVMNSGDSTCKSCGASNIKTNKK